MTVCRVGGGEHRNFYSVRSHLSMFIWNSWNLDRNVSQKSRITSIIEKPHSVCGRLIAFPSFWLRAPAMVNEWFSHRLFAIVLNAFRIFAYSLVELGDECFMLHLRDGRKINLRNRNGFCQSEIDFRSDESKGERAFALRRSNSMVKSKWAKWLKLVDWNGVEFLHATRKIWTGKKARPAVAACLNAKPVYEFTTSFEVLIWLIYVRNNWSEAWKCKFSGKMTSSKIHIRFHDGVPNDIQMLLKDCRWRMFDVWKSIW